MRARVALATAAAVRRHLVHALTVHTRRARALVVRFNVTVCANVVIVTPAIVTVYAIDAGAKYTRIGGTLIDVGITPLSGVSRVTFALVATDSIYTVAMTTWIRYAVEHHSIAVSADKPSKAMAFVVANEVNAVPAHALMILAFVNFTFTAHSSISNATVTDIAVNSVITQPVDAWIAFTLWHVKFAMSARIARRAVTGIRSNVIDAFAIVARL